MFVVFHTARTSSPELISSVYWKLQENLFISLSGKVILKFKETNFKIKSKILEESSSTNLVKLFANIREEEDEPLRNLIKSLMRLAQVNLNDNNCNDANANDYEIYFQSSVIINGKREYPLYILRTIEDKCDEIDIIVNTLITTSTLNEKMDLIEEFYSKYSEDFDTKIFSNEQVYISLRHGGESKHELELGKMIKTVKIDYEMVLKTTGITLEQLNQINFAELKDIFDEMTKERTPKGKLEKLVKLHSNLTESSNTLVNADLLLPLLTCVIIKITDEGFSGNISGEVKYIERFARQNELSGLNGYVLTSMVRWG